MHLPGHESRHSKEAQHNNTCGEWEQNNRPSHVGLRFYRAVAVVENRESHSLLLCRLWPSCSPLARPRATCRRDARRSLWNHRHSSQGRPRDHRRSLEILGIGHHGAPLIASERPVNADKDRRKEVLISKAIAVRKRAAQEIERARRNVARAKELEQIAGETLSNRERDRSVRNRRLCDPRHRLWAEQGVSCPENGQMEGSHDVW
jgi:hypothetical protein